VSDYEGLLFNSNSAIFQLYHRENMLVFNDDEVHFVLDQHTLLDFYSAKQQSADRHVAPLLTKNYPDSEPTSLCSFSLMLHA
jgi:hypothetical protein